MDKLVRAFWALGPIDAKSVIRDGLLLTLILVPAFLTAAARFGVPPLTAWLERTYGFDLSPYYPLILSLLAVQPPTIVGILVGFLLLDERDERTLTALAVTPLGAPAYLAYRLGLPLVLGCVITVLSVMLAGLVSFTPTALAAIGTVSMLTAPITTLVLGVFAANKVAGLALQKFLSGIFSLPLLAYFTAPPLQYLFAVLPPYWPMKLIWVAAEGAPMAPWLIGGLLVNGIAAGALIRLFRKRMS